MSDIHLLRFLDFYFKKCYIILILKRLGNGTDCINYYTGL